jgi:hypothetical protein
MGDSGHWIAHDAPETVKVQPWKMRKKNKMNPRHIKKAWIQLKDENGLDAVPSLITKKLVF